MQDFFRAIAESGTVPAIIAIVMGVLAQLVRFLAPIFPSLLRAGSERNAVQRALKAKTKADFERACRVLEILQDARTSETSQLNPETPADSAPSAEQPQANRRRRQRKRRRDRPPE